MAEQLNRRASDLLRRSASREARQGACASAREVAVIIVSIHVIRCLFPRCYLIVYFLVIVVLRIGPGGVSSFDLPGRIPRPPGSPRGGRGQLSTLPLRALAARRARLHVAASPRAATASAPTARHIERQRHRQAPHAAPSRPAMTARGPFFEEVHLSGSRRLPSCRGAARNGNSDIRAGREVATGTKGSENSVYNQTTHNIV